MNLQAPGAAAAGTTGFTAGRFTRLRSAALPMRAFEKRYRICRSQAR